MKVRTAVVIALCACGPGVVIDVQPDAGPDAGSTPFCGDGVRNGVEECDNGEKNGANAGCEKDCSYSCVPFDAARGDSRCDPHDPCQGKGRCGDDHICRVADPLPTGASCGDSKICRNGACQAPVCGDDIVTAPEECDDGKNDGAHGCNADCRFTCVAADPARSCAPEDPCQGPSACSADHLCGPRTPLADGTACGPAKICKSAHCVAASCGDGFVQPPEECDPPDGVTCDASCRKIVHPVCGNGTREPGEQCDDGNLVNLDGCDSSCRFEQEQRANSVRMQYATDSTCTANALGAAIGSAARSTLQNDLDASVAGGSLTMAFQLLGLADLSGTNAASFKLGGMTGTPAPAPPGHAAYDGTHDLDWWYTAAAKDIDAQRIPLAQIDGKIVSKVLTAGPGRMSLTVVLGGGPVQLAASGVKLRADVGAAGAPLQARSATPGHLPAENLDPALVSFESLANGKLCGNVSAYSLQQVPAPLAVQSGGSTPCDQGYTSANSMLDVVVRGCIVYGFITAVSATQPDQIDPASPAAGAGGLYKLSAGSGKVESCVDKSGAPVDLTTCLKVAAYSTYLQLTTDRVIVK